jgi:hypothetical protein
MGLWDYGIGELKKNLWGRPSAAAQSGYIIFNILPLHPTLSPLGLCRNRKPRGRQSGSKALECGSFRLWEIIACIRSNVFKCLACVNPNG